MVLIPTTASLSKQLQQQEYKEPLISPATSRTLSFRLTPCSVCSESVFDEAT
jgi:hypothetical protein